ncbi:hypothetical protein AVEN_17275-1, partial [Araneus ventricosus]
AVPQRRSGAFQLHYTPGGGTPRQANLSTTTTHLSPTPALSGFLSEPHTPSPPTHTNLLPTLLWPGNPNGLIDIGTGWISNFPLHAMPILTLLWPGNPNGLIDIGTGWISNFPLHAMPILTGFHIDDRFRGGAVELMWIEVTMNGRLKLDIHGGATPSHLERFDPRPFVNVNIEIGLLGRRVWKFNFVPYPFRALGHKT